MIKSYFWAARQLESLVFVNKCKTRVCRTLQRFTDLAGHSTLRRDQKAHSGSKSRLTRFSPGAQYTRRNSALNTRRPLWILKNGEPGGRALHFVLRQVALYRFLPVRT